MLTAFGGLKLVPVLRCTLSSFDYGLEFLDWYLLGFAASDGARSYWVFLRVNRLAVTTLGLLATAECLTTS